MGGKKSSETIKRWETANPPLYARVDPDTKQEVLEYAKRKRVSQAEALRLLIEFGLAEVNKEHEL